MEGGRKGQPLYMGVFASEPKVAAKTVKQMCNEAILLVLKHAKPESYLQEGEKSPKGKEANNEWEKILDEGELNRIQKDFATFQTYSAPNDNYHITSLFIGGKKDNLKKQGKQILNNWKNGVKENIKVDFIVYVPNYLLAGSVSQLKAVEVENRCPHMTLLLKQKAKAMESNAVLELVFDRFPEIFKERSKKVSILKIPYQNVSKCIIVIDTSFELEGIAGDNLTHGKK